MEWYFLALLTPALWAINNVFIKFLRTNKFPSYLSMLFAFSSMDTIFALMISLFCPIMVYLPYSLFAFTAGLLPMVAFWFYSKALAKEEITRVITLFQLIPVFVVILSFLFLEEILGIQKYIGIGLIVVGSILISQKNSSSKQSSGVLKLMAPFGIIIAVYTIVDKILLGFLNYWSVFFWNIVGTFCGVLILLLSMPSMRKQALEVIVIAGERSFFLTFIGEGLYVSGTICSLAALSLVDASLASPIFALQPFFVFFLMIFLSIFYPGILKEEVNTSTVFSKLASIVLMFVGTWLVI